MGPGKLPYRQGGRGAKQREKERTCMQRERKAKSERHRGESELVIEMSGLDREEPLERGSPDPGLKRSG